jgi:hypothetical protein
MKIHITENIDKIIDGYKMVPVLYGKIDLSMVPNNAATEIIAADALDSIPSSLVTEFISSIRNKMRFGCKLILGGTELSVISNDIVNGKIPTDEFNNVIFNKRGIYKAKDIVELVNSHDLKVDSVTIKGYQYELAIIRPNTPN